MVQPAVSAADRRREPNARRTPSSDVLSATWYMNGDGVLPAGLQGRSSALAQVLYDIVLLVRTEY